MAGRYFEDFKTGERFDSEGLTLTQAQIIEFALTWDPQPFHMDVEAADRSAFGGLVASGFHVAALTVRLIRDTGLMSGTGLGTTAADDVHWLKPVRPGDTLSVRAEVVEITPARARTDRGFVRLRYTTSNQNREVVMTMNLNHVVARRSEGSGVEGVEA